VVEWRCKVIVYRVSFDLFYQVIWCLINRKYILSTWGRANNSGRPIFFSFEKCFSFLTQAQCFSRKFDVRTLLKHNNIVFFFKKILTFKSFSGLSSISRDIIYVRVGHLIYLPLKVEFLTTKQLDKKNIF
jgi:hypothetical protein